MPDDFERICARLLKREPFDEPLSVALKGDLDLNPGIRPKDRDGGPKPAAVLIPFIEQEGEIRVVLTRRAEDLPDHGGQISFPGGLQEEGEDPVTAALRESREEIGLPHDHVHILGQMPLYMTSTGFEVTPVIGFIEREFKIIPDEREVAEVFQVPLAFLINEQNHKKHSREFLGKPRFFYAIPYQGYYIWGATAAMIINLTGLLKDYAGR